MTAADIATAGAVPTVSGIILSIIAPSFSAVSGTRGPFIIAVTATASVQGSGFTAVGAMTNGTVRAPMACARIATVRR